MTTRELGAAMRLDALRFLVLAASIFALSSCTEDKPGNDKIIEQVLKRTPASMAFSLTSTELKAVNETTKQVNFKGVLSLKEPLYIRVSNGWALAQAGLLPPHAKIDSYGDALKSHLDDLGEFPVFLAKIGETADAETVYGRCLAEKNIDKWNVLRCEYEFASFSSASETPPKFWQGKSRKEFAGGLVVASPEADAYFARMKQMRQQRRDAFYSHIAGGQVYVGSVTEIRAMPFSRTSTRIKMTFESVSADGENVTLRIDSKDHYSIFKSELRKFLDETRVDNSQFPLAMAGTDVFSNKDVLARQELVLPGMHFASKTTPLLLQFKDNSVFGVQRGIASNAHYLIQATRENVSSGQR